MYLSMMPRLEADQEIRGYRVALAVGGMGMNETGRMKYLDGLERQMIGQDRPQAATSAELAGMGIRIADTDE